MTARIPRAFARGGSADRFGKRARVRCSQSAACWHKISFHERLTRRGLKLRSDTTNSDTSCSTNPSAAAKRSLTAAISGSKSGDTKLSDWKLAQIDG